MSRREVYPVRLVVTMPLAENVRHFELEVPGAERFEFTPGQHVRISFDLEDGEEHRYFSIASPPRDDNRFELCVTISPDAGGRALENLAPGTELRCWGPSGTFGLRKPLRDSLFIGTGTGVAPLRSMVLSIVNDPLRRDRHIALLLGARTPEMLLYRDELEKLAAERENFEFWPTLTRADGDWAGRRGRVLMHLADALSQCGRSTDIYLCGQPEMVSSVRRELLAAGLDEQALFYEKYY